MRWDKNDDGRREKDEAKERVEVARGTEERGEN